MRRHDLRALATRTATVNVGTSQDQVPANSGARLYCGSVFIPALALPCITVGGHSVSFQADYRQGFTNSSLFVVASGGGINLGESVRIYDGCNLNALDGEISIGDHSLFGPNMTIYGFGSVSIGSYVAVASYTTIVASNHNFADRATYICRQGSTGKGVWLEDDVWIGANCVILDGVNVGAGAVVAAGSVVNRNVESYTVVGGVPAGFLKKR